jgi:putative FmdB family regulatory protein
MPTYEYECKTCGIDFDIFQSMSDEPLKFCPTCGKTVRRKINGGMGVIFKGSGFYSNDNKKSSSSIGAPKSDGAGSSGAAKPGSESSSASTAAVAAPKQEAPAKKDAGKKEAT